MIGVDEPFAEGISGHPNDKVILDIGKINCVDEPMLIQIGKQRIIVRYKCSAREGDYGKLTLERLH